MKNVTKICAGIVTFNPDIERLYKVIESITGQAEQLLVIDNGSKNIDDIEKLLCSDSKISLIKYRNNYGIAKALNNICIFASENRYEWALTLDQDTICPHNLISEFSKAISFENIGIICPAVIYEGMNFEIGSKEKEFEEDYACMTSASLTNVDVWKKVGGFREDFFIDFVDNEYCLKLQIFGYKIIRVNTCSISHMLGTCVKKKLLWKEVYGTTHRPWRFYYMIRNNLVYIKDYGNHLNRFKEYIKVLYILAQELIFTSQKKAILSYAWKGLFDACHNKMGKQV